MRAGRTLNPTAGLKKAVAGIWNKSDTDIILFSGPIRPKAYGMLLDQIEKRRRREDLAARPNVMLILTTNGGSADTAFQIGRCLQRRYCDGNFTLFVATYCKSAGTLIATGADEIVMTESAELGPLDVQVYKSDELGEYTSGLTPIQSLLTLRVEAFKTFEYHFLNIRYSSGFQITTRLAAQIAARLTNGCFSPIYQQVDPMRLGELQRAMSIAFHYGDRLNRGNLKNGALSRLVSEYPSHDFIIDRDEAGDLFERVREPTPAEQKLAALLAFYTNENVSPGAPFIRFLTGDVQADFYSHDQGDHDAREQSRDGDAQPSPRSGRRKPDRKGGEKPGTGRGRSTKAPPVVSSDGSKKVPRSNGTG